MKALLLAIYLPFIHTANLTWQQGWSFDFSNDKVRGVSLGGWFVLEPWITPSIFAPWADNSEVVDEYTFTRKLGQTEAKSQLEAHWESWITQDDFREIAYLGLNHVRIPIGYWALNPLPGDPYVQGQLPILDNAIEWARNTSLKVLLDLHGAPGSQNGFDNSGREGPIEWEQNQTISQTLTALDSLSKRYENDTDVISTIELLNEPANWGLNMTTLKQFYYDGVGTVRNTHHEFPVTIHDAYKDLSYWNGFMNYQSGVENIILDTHVYQIFTEDLIALKPCNHVQTACNMTSRLNSTDKWTIVGEWTAAQTDCAKWLNGLGKGARYDGSLSGSNGYYGDCQAKYQGTVDTMLDIDKTNLEYFVEAQMDAYEAHTGWIFWAWKTESAPEWHFQNLTRAGLVPQPLTSRKHPAQALGLHRDGTKFGISPFNTEMRRRLWWQICILDVRASEDHGFELSIRDQSFDTKFPLSINDIDIQPDATEAPVPLTGVSEMTPCLIRMEICHLTRRLFYASPGNSALPVNSKPLSFEEREKMLKDTADRMEEQYLQYCAYAGPVYWSAAVVCRLILAKTALLIYQPLTHPAKPNELPQATKDRLFIASIEIIEFARSLAMDPTSGRFSWLFKTYTQWHAVAYIPSELAARPPSPLVERAWGAVIIFRNAGTINSSTRTGMLWKPLRLLLAKALRKREENKRLQPSGYYGLGMGGQYTHPPSSMAPQNPNFMTTPSAPNPNFRAPPNAFPQAPGTFIQQPQFPGMGPQFPADPRVVLMQEQQLVQMQNQPPFLANETAMQGLGMSNLDMADVDDANWDRWNQLVPGYHTEPSHNWWGA